MYNIEYTQEAINDLKRLQKSEPKVYEKARRLIAELAEHPKTGLGHPEPLKGQPEGRWSRELTKKHGVVLILDEVQSGCGRTGKYFAHQWAGITPDLITMAKGLANGIPIGGVLISPEFKATKGMLGTTFGGNYIAMAGAIAVAGIIKEENLMANAKAVGDYILKNIPDSPKIKDVRGRGMMVGIEFNCPIADIRNALLYEKHIFTGVAGNNMLRLLAPLVLTKADVDIFINALKELL